MTASSSIVLLVVTLAIFSTGVAVQTKTETLTSTELQTTTRTAIQTTTLERTISLNNTITVASTTTIYETVTRTNLATFPLQLSDVPGDLRSLFHYTGKRNVSYGGS